MTKADGHDTDTSTNSSLAGKLQQDHDQTVTAIADESIARDVQHDSTDQERRPPPPPRDHSLTEHSLALHPHRPSFTGRPHPIFGLLGGGEEVPTEQEREEALRDERSLLRDNHIIPPKHPRSRSVASNTALRKPKEELRSRTSVPGFSIPYRSTSSSTDHDAVQNDVSSDEPTETTALLPSRDSNASFEGLPDPESIDQKWEEAVLSGRIRTSWQREAKVILRYAAPGVVTYILQNSLTMTSIFTVGHIGKIELGAVSLGSMTANITGYALFHGLTTSLDTLCAQAYGSGRKQLVGLQLQRMVYFLWLTCIPVSIIWAFGTQILAAIIPEQDIAHLAGQYLKILIFGAPAYALFEAAKRYVQAQGRFEATTYVLLICAPINVFMHWLFVWKLQWGFIGCPIAVVITENLLPVVLFLYVYFFLGFECWPGFTRQAFTNWVPMIRLSAGGVFMIMAEFLAFETLTLSSSWISATHLGANTILQNLSMITYQLPFPLSIAASTRVANLIGASLPEAAVVTTRVAFIIAAAMGLLNMGGLLALRYQVVWLFTNDADVATLAATVLPVNAAFQLGDALAAVCNGLLRGLGKQEIGGLFNVFAYYVVALPISFGTAFGLHWDLYGLWFGPAVGLSLISAIEGYYIHRLSFKKASEEAAKRNAAG